MRRQFLRATTALLVAAALGGCGNLLRDQEAAAHAMDDFYDRSNAGDYSKIYDTAGSVFQGETVRADFLQRLDAIHRKLGNYQTCRGQKSSSYTGDVTVELHYKTTFAEGAADEDFTYTIVGNHATLRRYRINSDALTAQ